MFKILLLIIIIITIYYIFFSNKDVGKNKNYKNSDTKQEQDDVDDLIPCEKCGTLITQNSAIISNGKYYCSETCIGN